MNRAVGARERLGGHNSTGALPQYLFSVLVPYQRSAAFTPLQRWTSSERLRIHEPQASADLEAASRPRSFGKALNTYLPQADIKRAVGPKLIVTPQSLGDRRARHQPLTLFQSPLRAPG